MQKFATIILLTLTVTLTACGDKACSDSAESKSSDTAE